MSGWRRRSVLAAGAAISTGTAITTTESGVAETDGRDGSSTGEPAGWSSYRGTAGNTAYVPSEGSFPEPEAVAWEYDESGRAAIVDGTVYLRTGGAVHALEDADGSVLWESEEIDADGTPAVVGDSVVVGGAELSALEADTGEVRWSETFDDTANDHEPAVTSPTVADGTVYVVAEESLFAFDLADGSVRWSRETVELEDGEAETEPQTETASFGSAPVAVANGLVYAVADEPGFAAFDVGDGQTAWTHWRDDYRGLSFSGIAATDERVYVSGSPEDDFPIVDAATGERLDAVPNVFTPAVTAEARVAASPDALRVRNYERGEDWEQVGGTAGWRNPSIVGETIVVPYYPGYNERAVYGLDLADGSERWEFTHSVVDEGGPSQWYAIAGDTIYTTGENGLVAIRQEEAEGTDEEDDANDEDEGGENDGEDDESDGGDQHADDEQESSETDGDDQESDEAGNDDETGDDTDGEPADEDESDGGESDGTGEYEPAEDDGNVTDDSASGEADDAADDDVTDTDVDENDAHGNETDDSDTGGDDGTTDTNDADERTDGVSDDTDPEPEDDDAEATPGFTTGAGIAGGVLGLEWLRRRATAEDDLEG
ncbi:PQQ-binding-like beta-propeller repeat protein [Natronococcus sp. A-GB7]|uniref:outer membrane protein assembly factor BamB family protein n=1 Tax=Natronococcus sp. A-GB7 TaxID=3037649 RepID=UPI00241DC842|nr:PQQ-binding-like beta-propeller repeat protein [Natronococcus sp. A-GB7]MDG5821182.1 PQQ-binding-like beta-propeller repeat protein [Natronococcus sp. A-GB7]